jgi:tetratricopeptide (TPR) repeat protein
MARTIKITDPFARTVEQALEHFGDATALGTKSPLAAPYFLGNCLAAHTPDTPHARGQALKTLLIDAAQHLPAEQRAVLDKSFFQRNTGLNNTAIAQALAMSETTYYRHRASAIEALAHEVNRAVLPPLRTETTRTVDLVGRETQSSAALAALHKNHTVAIVGPNGIGKSALGSELAQYWPQRAFWFTVRPDDPDPFTHFVFALGYFLRQLGQSNTWRQLVADQGVVHPSRVLGLLRHDLHMARDPAPGILICVDDVNVLRDDVQPHAQFVYLLESLHAVTPIVLMGKQVDLPTDLALTLTGLTPADVRRFAPDLREGDAQALQHSTLGNAALLQWSLSLWRLGEPMPAVLRALADARSEEQLLQRLWHRLNEDLRAVLAALCVFRAPAPRDAWPEWKGRIEELVVQSLLHDDGMGGIALAPALCPFVSRRLSETLLTNMHLQAGEILAARGDYTAAAFHFVKSNNPRTAIWLWLTHHELEIGRGHAADARALFGQVDMNTLDPEAQRGLTVLQAEQTLLAGDAETTETLLAQYVWPSTHALTPWARQLMGDALERQGRIEQAAANYRDALLALDAQQPRVVRHAIGLHVKHGYLFINRTPDLAQARRDANLALWRAHNFAGHVAQESGQYDTALAQYTNALAFAEQVNDPVALARTHQHLGALFVRMGRADSAIHHLQQALTIDDTIGDPMNKLFDLLNLSSAFVVGRRHEDALTVAVDGLSLAREMKHGFLSSGFTASAGEASFYLGRLDDAERYSLACLHEEEEVFRPLALTVLAWVRQAQHDLNGAEKLLTQAITNAHDIDDVYAEAAAWKSLGEIQIQRGADARPAFEQARSKFQQLGLVQEVAALEILFSR